MLCVINSETLLDYGHLKTLGSFFEFLVEGTGGGKKVFKRFDKQWCLIWGLVSPRGSVVDVIIAVIAINYY